MVPNAQAQIITQSERVRVGDLNLATERGRAKLDRRIRSAAGKVYSLSSPRPGLVYAFPDAECVKQAIASTAPARGRLIERAIAVRGAGPDSNIPINRRLVRPTMVAEEASKPVEFSSVRAR